MWSLVVPNLTMKKKIQFFLLLISVQIAICIVQPRSLDFISITFKNMFNLIFQEMMFQA